MTTPENDNDKRLTVGDAVDIKYKGERITGRVARSLTASVVVVSSNGERITVDRDDPDMKRASDEAKTGEITIVASSDGHVYMEFEELTRGIALAPDQAIDIGVMLIENAAILRHMASTIETEGSA